MGRGRVGVRVMAEVRVGSELGLWLWDGVEVMAMGRGRG